MPAVGDSDELRPENTTSWWLAASYATDDWYRGVAVPVNDGLCHRVPFHSQTSSLVVLLEFPNTVTFAASGL